MQVFGNGHETGERTNIQDTLLMQNAYHRRLNSNWRIISIGGIFKDRQQGSSVMNGPILAAATFAIAFSLAAPDSTQAAGGAKAASEILGRVSASRIAVISDGDFLAQTYGTAELAPREAGYRDLLTIMSQAENKIVTRSIPISNSVTSAPEILALTKDGRTAFVTERLGSVRRVVKGSATCRRAGGFSRSIFRTAPHVSPPRSRLKPFPRLCRSALTERASPSSLTRRRRASSRSWPIETVASATSLVSTSPTWG